MKPTDTSENNSISPQPSSSANLNLRENLSVSTSLSSVVNLNNTANDFLNFNIGITSFSSSSSTPLCNTTNSSMANTDRVTCNNNVNNNELNQQSVSSESQPQISQTIPLNYLRNFGISNDSDTINQRLVKNNTNMAILPLKSNNYTTINTNIQQQPSSSAISSSSSNVLSCSTSSQSKNLSLTLTSRDWFTYVYKIDNIEELINKTSSFSNNNKALNSVSFSENSFVQSPIFSFTNHLIYNNNSTYKNNITIAGNSSSIILNSSNLINDFSSSSSSSSNLTNFNNNDTANLVTPIQQQPNHNSNFINSATNYNNNDSSFTNQTESALETNTSSNTAFVKNEKSSNWRLIFYPNGAGGDCKNFLSIFLKYLSDEPVKIQMMFSIVDNFDQDVYVKYTVNKFNKSNDWGFKQLIHKNAILYQKEKFLKFQNNSVTSKSGGTLSIRVKMRLDEQRHDYIKNLNDNLHYCKLLSENFNQYYYNDNINNNNNNNNNDVKNEANTNFHFKTDVKNTSSMNKLLSVESQTFIKSHSITTNTLLPAFQSEFYIRQPAVNFPSHTNSSYSSNYDNYKSNIYTNDIENNENSSYFDLILLVKSDITENNDNYLCTSSNNNNNNNLNSINTFLPSISITSLKSNRRNLTSLTNENQNNFNNQVENLNHTSTIKRIKLCHDHLDNSSQLSIILPKSASFGNVTSSTKFSDFIEFRAHKCILAARSPVFRAMFNYRLKENLTNKLIIEDCKPEVVKAMLKYIYTAYIPDDNLSSIALDLYIAAEKYFIESLKIKCRELLIENLTNDSVIHTYILSEIYNDSMLRKKSLKHISDNIEKVTQNSDWNEFMLTYPQFFTNAFIRLCKKDF